MMAGVAERIDSVTRNIKGLGDSLVVVVGYFDMMNAEFREFFREVDKGDWR